MTPNNKQTKYKDFVICAKSCSCDSLCYHANVLFTLDYWWSITTEFLFFLCVLSGLISCTVYWSSVSLLNILQLQVSQVSARVHYTFPLPTLPQYSNGSALSCSYTLFMHGRSIVVVQGNYTSTWWNHFMTILTIAGCFFLCLCSKAHCKCHYVKYCVYYLNWLSEQPTCLSTCVMFSNILM